MKMILMVITSNVTYLLQSRLKELRADVKTAVAPSSFAR